MKRICLIRHGKSSWKYPDLTDRERPLKKRGLREAPMMGRLLAKRGIQPDLIIASPAERAHATAKLVAEEVGYQEDHIRLEEALYFEGIKELLHVVHGISDSHETSFLVGHNPDLTDFANKFSENPIENIPTSGIVVIDFDAASFREAGYDNGNISLFDYPSLYR